MKNWLCKLIKKSVFMLCFALANLQSQAQVLLKKQTTLMGSVFNFTLVDKDSITAKNNMIAVIAEIERIENLISEWRPQTQISEVNKNAGIQPVKVDLEVFELTKRALEYSKITDGAFDISIVALDKIWKFDGSMDSLPNELAIAKSVANVGYQNIMLDSVNSTIYLAKKGMKIGFGSIGKAYAADKGKALMIANGVKGGIVNASGDLTTWGLQPSGKPWLVGITNPFKRHRLIKTLKMNENAVVTSGSYEKFVVFNGKRYSHIINPATGYPATGLCSVTVFGPNAETANGLSTSMMVLGQTEGLFLLQKFPDYSCIMITDNGKVIKSKNLSIKKFKAKL